jgi:hypothetical protein
MLDLSGVGGGGTFPKSIAEQERPSPAAESGRDGAYKAYFFFGVFGCFQLETRLHAMADRQLSLLRSPA